MRQSAHARLRSRRRTLIRAIVIGAGAIAAYAVLALVLGLWAYRDVHSAQAAVHRASADDGLARIVTGDVTELDNIEHRLDHAHGLLDSVWLAPLRHTPLIRRQLASALALSSTTSTIVHAAAVHLRMPAGNATATQSDAGARAQALVDRVANALAPLSNALAHAELGPERGLLPPLASARKQTAQHVERLRASLASAQAIMPGIRRFLAGPSVYLAIAGNNSEMAAGAVMPLATGLISVDGGHVTSQQWQSIDKGVPPPGTVAAVGPLRTLLSSFAPQDDLRRLNLSPSFNLVAPMAAAQYEATTGVHVSGVMLIDVAAVQELSSATGGLTISGTRVAPADVGRVLQHDQYVPLGTEISGETSKVRHEAIVAAAVELFVQLQSKDANDLSTVHALGRATRGRHLLVWSADADEQNAWDALGAAGRLPDDSLMVALQNRGSNKLDWFTRVSVDVHATAIATETRVELTVRAENRSPTSGEPRYVTGPNTDEATPPGQYRGLLMVYVPSMASQVVGTSAQAATIDGVDGPVRAIGWPVTFGPGETVTASVRFVLPSSVRTVVVQSGGRRPAAGWTAAGDSWTDDSAHRIALR